jgi:hypothetical protein
MINRALECPLCGSISRLHTSRCLIPAAACSPQWLKIQAAAKQIGQLQSAAANLTSPTRASAIGPSQKRKRSRCIRSIGAKFQHTAQLTRSIERSLNDTLIPLSFNPLQTHTKIGTCHLYGSAWPDRIRLAFVQALSLEEPNAERLNGKLSTMPQPLACARLCR